MELDGKFKTALIKGNKLSMFVDAFELLKAKNGESDNLTMNAAIDAVCPELKRFKWKRKNAKGSAANGAKAADARCNGFRMLEWVVERFEDKLATREDAPNAAAWSVLVAARGDSDIYRDVLKKYLDSKLKLDAAAGDTDTHRLDGQAEYDILEGMAAEEYSA